MSTEVTTVLTHFRHRYEKRADKQPARLYGELESSPSGWLLLRAPNPLVRGIFSVLDDPKATLPLRKSTGELYAHISVMTPDDVKKAGGFEKIVELGESFSYELQGLMAFYTPQESDYDKVWALTVKSEELENLRKNYGLSRLPNNNKYEFHITCAVRPR